MISTKFTLVLNPSNKQARVSGHMERSPVAFRSHEVQKSGLTLHHTMRKMELELQKGEEDMPMHLEADLDGTVYTSFM